MEIVLVKLSDKTSKIAVFEVFGKYIVGELIVLPITLAEVPGVSVATSHTSSTTKLSPESPHLTMDAY
jgi:hypothetical protein